MKKKLLFVRLAGFLSVILFLLWVLKIHNYYFNVETVDLIGLIVIGTSSYCMGLFIKTKLPNWVRSILVIFLVITSYFIISEAVLMISRAWYLTYLLLFSMATLLGQISTVSSIMPPLLATILVWFLPFSFLEGQPKYHEKLMVEYKTRDGLLEITQWKRDFWYYYNGELQFSSLDGHMYGEAAVHPAMSAVKAEGKALVVGGENGLVSKELNKYEQLDWQLLAFDPTYANFMHAHQKTPIPKLITVAPEHYLTETNNAFDLIIVDISDLQTLRSEAFYTPAFFQVCYGALKENGMLVISSGDIHIDPSRLLETRNALKKCEFNFLSYDVQIPTIGQWSWVLASKATILESGFVPPTVDTRWYNQEALEMMLEIPQLIEQSR